VAQAAVYLSPTSVHPALVLQLRGRVVRCVAFEPPALSFGTVASAAGAWRRVRVTFDPGLFVPGRTVLAAPDDGAVAVIPDRAARAERPLWALHGSVTRCYRVGVAPPAPIGPVSGVLRVMGLAGPAQGNPAGPGTVLPFSGRVTGSVSALPDRVVFGRVPVPAAGPVGAAADRDHRTRWVLVTAGGGAIAQATGPNGAGAIGTFWKRARVTLDSRLFEGDLVPLSARTRVQAGSGTAPEKSTGAEEERSRWLRVTLRSSAPRGKPLACLARVDLPNGERLRLPVRAERD
jgi:hypothetical protein